MNIGLLVKRVAVDLTKITYKGDAITNIAFSDTGVILSWGEGDRFEISFGDFMMLRDIAQTVLNKIERESYQKLQSGSTTASKL
jgi:hypothetical protein